MNHLSQAALSMSLHELEPLDRDAITDEAMKLEIERNKERFPMPGIDWEWVESNLRQNLSIWEPDPTIIENEGLEKWVRNRDAKDWKFYGRYRGWLQKEDPRFPIQQLDRKTDDILDRCADPKKEGRWDRRGLVVGNVQSGKTRNYIGLINKAIDSGYRMVIVMAGVHNILRAQTQSRIDHGVVGMQSADLVQRLGTTRYVGVGNMDPDFNGAVNCLTSTPYRPQNDSARKGGDFSRATAQQLVTNIRSSQDAWLVVIKKNKSILENLILWLNQLKREGEGKLDNFPVLVIDDEADNASVNSGPEEDPKTINRLIRVMLELFGQKTFVGYTATPYANLFIPDEWAFRGKALINGQEFEVGPDLFPRDFIVNLMPGTNYMGAEVVFGRLALDNDDRELEGLDVFHPITDNLPPGDDDYDGGAYIPLKQGPSDPIPDGIPESLKEAVRNFVLVVATREARGQGKKHDSMLVHVSYRVAWIDGISMLVDDYFQLIRQHVRVGDRVMLADLKNQYESEFLSKTDAIKASLNYDDAGIVSTPWSNVLLALQSAVDKIEVRAVHATRRGVQMPPSDLLYEDHLDSGLHVIAVGGGKLSRGLTLEGLSVSYFLRTTRMYDSLMQMGRWFGYRMGYADLCRIYTTPTLYNQFRHITMATEEIRKGFDEMFHQGLRPVDVQLKVRTDPNRELLITATNRMRNAERALVTFGGKTLQTYRFLLDPKIQLSNATLVGKFINSMAFDEKKEGKKLAFVSSKVDSLKVISLLEEWKFQDDLDLEFRAALEYWRKQIVENIGLETCSVAIPVNSNNVIGVVAGRVLSNPHNGIVSNRTDVQVYHIGGSAGLKLKSFYRSLAPDKTLVSLETTRNHAIMDASQRRVDLRISSTLRGDELKKAVFDGRRNSGPLLVLMPLDSRVDDRLSSDVPLFGLGLILPSVDNELPIEYMVNQPAIMFDPIAESPLEDDTASVEE